jgi:hypothetical protein
LNAGSHWSLDYSPSWQTYSNPAYHNAFAQQAVFQGNANYGDWALGASQSYSQSSVTTIETASQVPQRDYVTGLHASYETAGQSSIDLSVSQNIQWSSTAGDYRDWSTQDWLNYPFSPTLNFGLGPGFGYTVESTGADMAYGSYKVRIRWQALEKLNLNFDAGGESREFIATGQGWLHTAVFDGSLSYQAFETTTVSATANRGIDPSYIAAEVTEDTSFGINLQQRLLQHFYFNASATESTTSYFASISGTVAGRHDTDDSYSIGLTTVLLQHLTAAIQYAHNRDTSSALAYSFASNQFTLSLGVAY